VVQQNLPFYFLSQPPHVRGRSASAMRTRADCFPDTGWLVDYAAPCGTLYTNYDARSPKTRNGLPFCEFQDGAIEQEDTLSSLTWSSNDGRCGRYGGDDGTSNTILVAKNCSAH
jgi:hypothetical protein